MNRTDIISQKHLRIDLPELKPGMVVKVWQKFTDTVTSKKGKTEQKEITKAFQGTIIAAKHGRGVSGTFTIRGEAAGQLIEKVFPRHTPTITKIEVVGTSKTRRAKLYFIRDLSPHQIRRKLRTSYAGS